VEERGRMKKGRVKVKLRKRGCTFSINFGF
jgi:hypothetical protein